MSGDETKCDVCLREAPEGVSCEECSGVNELRAQVARLEAERAAWGVAETRNVLLTALLREAGDFIDALNPPAPYRSELRLVPGGVARALLARIREAAP